jgi:hypothetical protein
MFLPLLRKSHAGLTIVESLTTLTVCILLFLILCPLALIHFGIIEREESATDGKSSGLAGFEDNTKNLSTPRLYKPSLIEGTNEAKNPTTAPERASLKKPVPENLPAAPIIPQPRKDS